MLNIPDIGSVERGPLIRISLAYVSNLAISISPIRQISGETTWGDGYVDVLVAQQELDGLLKGSVYLPALRSCYQPGKDLLSALDELIAIKKQHTEDEKMGFQADFAKYKANEFWTIFSAEMGVVPAYFVHPKGGYDAVNLLDYGEVIFPSALSEKVPEALFDAKEAAKALAFELSTACGYHCFRALEAVVRSYLKHVTNGNGKPKQRNLGVYIRALSENGGDGKIIAALQQIKDLHRNPVAHPEVNLTLEDAISVLGMTRSVMAAILTILPELTAAEKLARIHKDRNKKTSKTAKKKEPS